jgi:hypothetical protein
VFPAPGQDEKEIGQTVKVTENFGVGNHLLMEQPRGLPLRSPDDGPGQVNGRAGKGLPRINEFIFQGHLGLQFIEATLQLVNMPGRDLAGEFGQVCFGGQFGPRKGGLGCSG